MKYNTLIFQIRNFLHESKTDIIHLPTHRVFHNELKDKIRLRGNYVSFICPSVTFLTATQSTPSKGWDSPGATQPESFISSTSCNKNTHTQSSSNDVNPHCGHCRHWAVYCQVPTRRHEISRNQTWVDCYTCPHVTALIRGERRSQGTALMSPQDGGVGGCCRRNQRAIHTADRPVYIL